MYIKKLLSHPRNQENFTVRPQAVILSVSLNRCCKVRVRRRRKQENGIYSQNIKITNKQHITKQHSLQGKNEYKIKDKKKIGYLYT